MRASEGVECKFFLPVLSRYCAHIRLLASSSGCQMLASLQLGWFSLLTYQKYEKYLIVYCRKAGKRILYIYKFSFRTDLYEIDINKTQVTTLYSEKILQEN